MLQTKISPTIDPLGWIPGFLSLVSVMSFMTAVLSSPAVQAADPKNTSVNSSAVFQFDTIDDFATVSVGGQVRLDTHLIGTHPSRAEPVIKDITMYLVPGDNEVRVVAKNSQHGGGQLKGTLMVDGKTFHTINATTLQKGRTNNRQDAKTDDTGIFYNEIFTLKGKPVPVTQSAKISLTGVDDYIKITLNGSEFPKEKAFQTAKGEARSPDGLGTNPKNKDPLTADLTTFLKLGLNKIELVGTNGPSGAGGIKGNLTVDGKVVYTFSESTIGPGDFGFLEFNLDCKKLLSISFDKETTFEPGAKYTDATCYLKLQEDGNLVVKTNDGDGYKCGLDRFMPISKLNTIAKCVFDDRGNLVAYDAGGNKVWSALQVDNTGGRLSVLDGMLQILDKNNNPVWKCEKTNEPYAFPNPFTFEKGVKYDNGAQYVILQTSGLFQIFTSLHEVELWNMNKKANPPGTPIEKVTFDGNLIAYDKSGKPVWSALQGEKIEGGRLLLNLIGKLVIVDAQGHEKWTMPY